MKHSSIKSRLSALLLTNLDKTQEPETFPLRRPDETITLRACGWSRFVAPSVLLGIGVVFAGLVVLWPNDGSWSPSVLMRLQQGGWVSLYFAGVGLVGVRYAWSYRVILNAKGLVIFNGFWHRFIAWEQIASREWRFHQYSEGGNQTYLYLLDKFGCMLGKLNLNMLAHFQNALLANIDAVLKDRAVNALRDAK